MLGVTAPVEHRTQTLEAATSREMILHSDVRTRGSAEELRARTTARWASAGSLLAVLVAGITTAGVLLRLPSFGDALFDDELSTYFIASSESIGGVVDLVRSDQEVTPPLYFVIAWATEGLGNPTQGLRLAPLIAGVATIPLTYQLGVWTVGRRAGLVGATLIALSPLLILQSTEARGHSVMLVAVLLSTIFLVRAVSLPRDGSGASTAWWWVGYAALSCAAIWTHYTAVFVLGGQFAWAWVARPGARFGLVAANVAVALAYMPWLATGFGEDRGSPGNLLEALHPFSVESATSDLGRWALGRSEVPLGSLPGEVAIAMAAAGIGVAFVRLILRAGLDRTRWRPSKGTTLVLVLALASPVGAVLYNVLVDSLMTPRNLIASWPGLALAVGALVSQGRLPVRVVGTALVLVGFGIGAGKMLDADHRRTDYQSAASFIERSGNPDSPVVEVPSSYNPLSPLEVALNDPGQSIEQNRAVFRVAAPTRRKQEQAREAGVPPVFPLPPPSTERLVRRAAELAQGDTLFVVIPSRAPPNSDPPDTVLQAVPSRFHHVETRRFPGFHTVSVYVFRDRARAAGGAWLAGDAAALAKIRLAE